MKGKAGGGFILYEKIKRKYLYMINSAEEFVRLRSSELPEEYWRAAHEEVPDAVWLDVIARFPDMRL